MQFRADIKPLWFYARMVKPNDLVFDIGANHGERTKVFRRLGARVVAVEPNPGLAAEIASRFGRKVVVEQAAVGDRDGHALLYPCQQDQMSSLSPQWITGMKRSPFRDHFRDLQWHGSISVPVTRLDSLIAKHGRPAFVKIDVEGFELQVLNGLSSPLPCLSFEHNPEFAEITCQCVRRLEQIGGYEFNFSAGESMVFSGRVWISADEAVRRLTSGCFPAKGDFYARRRVAALLSWLRVWRQWNPTRAR